MVFMDLHLKCWKLGFLLGSSLASLSLAMTVSQVAVFLARALSAANLAPGLLMKYLRQPSSRSGSARGS